MPPRFASRTADPAAADRPVDDHAARGSHELAPPAAVAEAAGVAGSPELQGALRPPPVAGPGRRRFIGFLAFAAVTSLPYLILPRTWVTLAGVLSWIVGHDVNPRPFIDATATIPGRLVAFHGLVLAVYWLPALWRARVAAVGAVGMGVALGIVDAPSVFALGAFCALMWQVFRLPIPRPALLALVVAGPLALRFVAHSAGWPALDSNGASLGLLVLLWYACYQVTTHKAVSFPQYAAYLQTRLLMEGPVLAPEDVRPAREEEIEATRRGGVKALAVAMGSRVIGFELDRILLTDDWQSATGLTLLGYSYVSYLSICFTLVFSYNLPLGLMRLLGFPVRDNFHWWFFARTPNEHWRRWNMLFREWLITFSFYPLMRARRNLFLAIMATLTASGLLHVYGRLFGGPLPLATVVLIMTYWLVNGLAIYTVVSFPRRFPVLTRRLRLQTNWAWWVVGWAATSAFYAVLFFVQRECRGLSDVGAYFSRLAGIGT